MQADGLHTWHPMSCRCSAMAMRAGPIGIFTSSQGDYNQSTIGGGNGDYKIIVLAPSTVQECVDLTYIKLSICLKNTETRQFFWADGLWGK